MRTVSVVIPTYNGERYLPRLLASLAVQRGVEWEAIVVIDGSTDQSREIVTHWADRAPIRCIPLARNEGRPTALNIGFAATAGDILVRCDDDLELTPSHLANHARHHEGAPVGVAGIDLDVFPDTAYACAYGRPATKNILRTAYTAPPADRWRFWAANCSVTRETFERVGPYDTSFREYGWEDIDWGFRLHQQGIPIVIPKDVETLHHHPALSAMERAEKAFSSGGSRRRFEAKHPNSGLAPPNAGSLMSPWSLAVRTTALWMRRRSVAEVARQIDRITEHAPGPMGHKVVSLAVEAAAMAGRQEEQ